MLSYKLQYILTQKPSATSYSLGLFACLHNWLEHYIFTEGKEYIYIYIILQKDSCLIKNELIALVSSGDN